MNQTWIDILGFIGPGLAVFMLGFSLYVVGKSMNGPTTCPICGQRFKGKGRWGKQQDCIDRHLDNED